MAVLTGLALKCRVCGVAVTYGSVLPFVHAEHRPTNVRPHYAQGIVAPLRAAGSGQETPPSSALSEPSDMPAPTQTVRRSG